jgi:beta-glucanase (GH16 family)
MQTMATFFRVSLATPVLMALLAVAGCSGGGASASGTGTGTQAAATPMVTAASAQNGAKIVSLSSTTSGVSIYYTIDGTTPTTSSIPYEAPFLVASNITVNAIATGNGYTASTVATQSFTPNLASGTLVWSDEFVNSTGTNAQPAPSTWAYDTGAGGWGNSELETYCGWNSSASPCAAASPNVYVGADGYLHIVAQQPSSGVYTSARMKSTGLFSFQYGRLEIRAQLPEQQGLWPAGWLLGNNYATVSWPGCGEMDVMERVNAAGSPDWNSGSIHGTGFTGSNLGTIYDFPSGQNAAGWHTYGMIWQKGSVSYYIDDYTKPYATYTPSSIAGFTGAVWPFDAGPQFLILNLAVGGSWPGSPNASTTFPAQMLVDYVRIYTN